MTTRISCNKRLDIVTYLLIQRCSISARERVRNRAIGCHSLFPAFENGAVTAPGKLSPGPSRKGIALERRLVILVSIEHDAGLCPHAPYRPLAAHQEYFDGWPSSPPSHMSFFRGLSKKKLAGPAEAAHQHTMNAVIANRGTPSTLGHPLRATKPAIIPAKVIGCIMEQVLTLCLREIGIHYCSLKDPCRVAFISLGPFFNLRLLSPAWDAAVRQQGTSQVCFATQVEDWHHRPPGHVSTKVRRTVLLRWYRVFSTIDSEDGM